jgi:peroxiredoxin
MSKRRPTNCPNQNPHDLQPNPQQDRHCSPRTLPSEASRRSARHLTSLRTREDSSPHARQGRAAHAARQASARRPHPNLLPSLQLQSATGAPVSLRIVSSGWLVIYCYPGAPEHDAPASHLEDIREHEAFKHRIRQFQRRTVSVAALSSQPLKQQVHTMLALGLEHHLLGDPDLILARSLGLPTTAIAGRTYYARQTLIIRERRIEHVLCPIEDARRSPIQVETWMLDHGW